MTVKIESDLHLKLNEHELVLRGDGENLTAEFDSLSGLRRMRKSLSAIRGPLDAVFRIAGLDRIKATIVVRGRAIAMLQTTGHVASTRILWWGLFATILHIPAPSRLTPPSSP